ncbi:MAG TPA: hypothetical protein VJ723_06865, partial [Candidatus Angelobacter sp.]|nr:hypothetical protein [Candidatus Angelobacter sp.]
MKKWIVTALVILGLVVAGIYVRAWLPVVLPLLRNHENADLLKSFSSIVQIALWLGGAIAFIFKLWRPGKKAENPSVPPVTAGNKQSAGVNVSGGDVSAV